VDAESFRRFQHAGWQAAAAGYGDGLTPLTAQAAGPLLDAAGVRHGTRVLEVASGPGDVAAAAARRDAIVTGVDFSAAIIELARRRHPAVDFREGEAEALPFAAGAYDAVVINFGLLHLMRPDRALAEARRVLRPGGRLAFTVWAPPDEAVVFGIVQRAIEAHGTLDVPLPPGPPMFRFSDPAACQGALAAAGFVAPAVTRVPLVWRIDSADALFEAMRWSTVGNAGVLRAQLPEALGAIRAAVAREAAHFHVGDAIELPMPAVLASAAKP
jgi:SAM-dependent methyltransferase